MTRLRRLALLLFHPALKPTQTVAHRPRFGTGPLQLNEGRAIAVDSTFFYPRFAHADFVGSLGSIEVAVCRFWLRRGGDRALPDAVEN